MNSTSLALRPHGIAVGQEYEVGAFFWTKDDDCIGFTGYADHGHQLSYGGSVGPDDKVEVLGIEGDRAVVVVKKPSTPYGAPCPHGMVFTMPISQILSWPAQVKTRVDKSKQRKALAEKYGVSPL